MSPYVFPESIRILGLQWDSRLCFAEHVNNVLSRAKIRHGVMSRLARSTWALEVGALRSSQAALLTSLAGYGLAAYGWGAYWGDLRRLGAQLVNASARRFTGVIRSARLAALHMAAGVLAKHNHYIRERALTLDRALRAHNCALRNQTFRKSHRDFSLATWCPALCELPRPEDRMPILGYRVETATVIPERWGVYLLPSAPRMPPHLLIPSTYRTSVHFTQERLRGGAGTFDFAGVSGWTDVGLQVLLASGWRPDCAARGATDREDIARAPPPAMDLELPMVFGSPQAMRWFEKLDVDYSESLVS